MTAFKFKAEVNLAWPKVMELALPMDTAVRNIARIVLRTEGKTNWLSKQNAKHAGRVSSSQRIFLLWDSYLTLGEDVSFKRPHI